MQSNCKDQGLSVRDDQGIFRHREGFFHTVTQRLTCAVIFHICPGLLTVASRSTVNPAVFLWQSYRRDDDMQGSTHNDHGD